MILTLNTALERPLSSAVSVIELRSVSRDDPTGQPNWHTERVCVLRSGRSNVQCRGQVSSQNLVAQSRQILEIYIFVGGFIRMVILALLRFIVFAWLLCSYVYTLHCTVKLTASRWSSVLCLILLESRRYYHMSRSSMSRHCSSGMPHNNWKPGQCMGILLL